MTKATLQPTIAAQPRHSGTTKWWEKNAKAPAASHKILQQINFNLGNFDDKNRTFKAVASTSIVDRQGDTIDQNGWDLSNFKLNPVVPWAHDYYSPPVARAIEIGVVDGVLEFTYQAPPEGLYELADIVWNLYRNQYLFAFSVGFIPKDEDGKEFSDWDWDGNNYAYCELLEISAVVVPANPQALALAYKMGVIDQRQTKQLIGKMQSTIKNLEDAVQIEATAADETLESADALEAVIERVLEKYMSKQAMETVTVTHTEKIGDAEITDIVETKGAISSSLPLADKDTSWDSGAAIKAIKSWASNSDGEIDFKRYKKCFMWVDSAGGDKQGDYKLPFANIIDDSPKAVWNAVKAIYGVLQGARGGVDIPEADKAAVLTQVKKYYKKFGEGLPGEDDSGKSLTGKNSDTDNETMDKVKNEAKDAKDLGESSGGGSALAPREMAKVKAAHDYLKDMSTTLSMHADALDDHAVTMKTHADVVSRKVKGMQTHLDALKSLLEPVDQGDETSENETADSTYNRGEKEEGLSNDNDNDGVDDRFRMGDTDHAGQEIEDEQHPDSGLTRLSATPDQAKSTKAVDGEVNSEDETPTEGADQHATVDQVTEPEVPAPEATDKVADSKDIPVASEDDEVDPDNLTPEQTQKLLDRVNERLAQEQLV